MTSTICTERVLGLRKTKRFSNAAGVTILAIICGVFASLAFQDNEKEHYAAVEMREVRSALTWWKGRLPCSWLCYMLDVQAESNLPLGSTATETEYRVMYKDIWAKYRSECDSESALPDEVILANHRYRTRPLFVVDSTGTKQWAMAGAVTKAGQDALWGLPVCVDEDNLKRVLAAHADIVVDMW